jgi:HD-GYP domain-containing protein (c-di-GMP phosphodiesterase class II)
VRIKTLYEKSIADAAHSQNVSKICKRIGKAMALSTKEISELEILGEIHDMGKIGIAENILNKTSKLNDEDWVEIKKHPEIGYHIALSSSELSFLADTILSHHEWYDGSGYPKGIKGEEIPLRARILAIADEFDAMTNAKPYRKPQTKNEAINELIKYKGKQFDPYLVDLFVNKVVDNI